MVFYILARGVLIGIPAGSEYPNVKCKNRSPFVSISYAYYVGPDGDVIEFINGVNWDSCGALRGPMMTTIRAM